MNLSRTVVEMLYRSHLTSRAFSAWTVKGYMRDLGVFFEWLDSNNKDDLREVTRDDLSAYQSYLLGARTPEDAERYRPGSRKQMFLRIRGVFRFLFRGDYLLVNPFNGFDCSMAVTKSTRRAIEQDEAATLLDGIAGEKPIALRDRALYELMYGTGLRVSEVKNLDVADIDSKERRVLVRQGKGKRDRVAPIGRTALSRLEEYLRDARPYFLQRAAVDRGALFLGQYGKRLGINSINERLKKYFQGSGNITAHMLRHSFATHLLENGAGVKDVKELLGHECIESTIVYTHVSIRSMKKILKKYHPRENEIYRELTDEDLGQIRRALKSDPSV